LPHDRFLRWTLWLLLAVSVLGLLSWGFVEETMQRQAEEVQPVARDPHGDGGWRLAGPTVELIGVPQAAYVTHAAPGIPAQVDSAGVRNDPNVVPFDSVKRTILIARLGAAAAIILLTGGLWANSYLGRFAAEVDAQNARPS